MYLSAVCPRCKMTYRVGDINNLPPTPRLMRTLADLVHDHDCSASKERLDTVLMSA